MSTKSRPLRMEPAMSFLQLPLNRQERRRLHRQSAAADRPSSVVAKIPEHSLPEALAVHLPAPLPTVEQQALLELLGQPPVAYHRLLVDVCGSLTAAVWCSLAIQLTREQSSDDLTFELSADACQERTGMTRREQDTARGKLRDLGLLQQQRRPRGMAYRLNLQELDRRIHGCVADRYQPQLGTGTHD